MKEISIRELHEKTGTWLRKARESGRIIVKDHGQPVATIVPFEERHRHTPFAERRLVPGFAAIAPIAGDCTQGISEDRDRL